MTRLPSSRRSPGASVPVRIQEQDFDLATEYTNLRTRHPTPGAVVSFIGLVRDMDAYGAVQELYLEHYPGMTERALHDIVAMAGTRWSLTDTYVIHRIGKLLPAEQIVMVMTAAPHRSDAFAACEFIIDFLKTEAPLWKREQTAQGTQWIETRDMDLQRTQRWESPGEKT